MAQTRKCDFYRQRLDEAGVGPDSIRSLDDLRRIPFTTKQDLRSQYPTGAFRCRRSEIVRGAPPSGTTRFAWAPSATQNDIHTLLTPRRAAYRELVRDDVSEHVRLRAVHGRPWHPFWARSAWAGHDHPPGLATRAARSSLPRIFAPRWPIFCLHTPSFWVSTCVIWVKIRASSPCASPLWARSRIPKNSAASKTF